MFYGEEGAVEIKQRIDRMQRLAKENNLTFREAYTHRYNLKAEDPKWKEGDLCLLHSPLMIQREKKIDNRKFVKPWSGPHLITKVHDNNTVDIRMAKRSNLGRTEFTVHFDRIKPYQLRKGKPHPFLGSDPPKPNKRGGQAPLGAGEVLPPSAFRDEEELALEIEEDGLLDWQHELDFDQVPANLDIRAPGIESPRRPEARPNLGTGPGAGREEPVTPAPATPARRTPLNQI